MKDHNFNPGLATAYLENRNPMIIRKHAAYNANRITPATEEIIYQVSIPWKFGDHRDEARIFTDHADAIADSTTRFGYAVIQDLIDE